MGDLDETTTMRATEKTLRDVLAAGAGNVAAGAVTSVSVGAVSTAVLAAAATRELAIVTNLSDANVYVAVGAAAQVGKGLPLAPAVDGGVGGSVTLTGPSAKLAVNAIVAAGSKSVAVQTGSSA